MEGAQKLKLENSRHFTLYLSLSPNTQFPLLPPISTSSELCQVTSLLDGRQKSHRHAISQVDRPGSTSLASSHISQVLSPTTESLVPDSAPFPSLYFAFEDGRGIPDTTNAQLVSGLAVRDLKLAQFFHLVTTRSNRPIDSVKLRYSWISANAIRFDGNIGTVLGKTSRKMHLRFSVCRERTTDVDVAFISG